MAKNKAIKKLGKSEYLIIDLTQPLREDAEVHPLDPKPEKIVIADFLKNRVKYNVYKIGDHHFQPHFDAPNHQNPELRGKGAEVYGLEQAFNSACMIDVSKKGKGNYLVEVKREHLEPFGELISKRGAVIVRTGYDKWIESNKKHTPGGLPYFSRDAAEFLAGFKNLVVVGIDSLTVDAFKMHDSHRALKEKFIIESLVHLYEIPENARENFTLQTSPVRIVGASGGPIVAYAFIELK